MNLGDKNMSDPGDSTQHPTISGQDAAEVEKNDYTENDTCWADAPFTLEQLKAKESGAWRELIMIFTHIAENYIRRSFTNPSDLQPLTFKDSEEITSAVAENIYKRIESIKTLDHLEASFRTGLRHRAIDRKRKMDTLRRGGGQIYSAGDPEVLPGKQLGKIEAELKARVEPHTNAVIEDDSSTGVEFTQDASTGNSLEQADLRKIIFDCATELSAPERELLGHIYADEQHHEIAKAMGISTSSVGSRLKRVFKKLEPKILAHIGQQGVKDYGLNTN
jgi:RNA polymerase sigma factor (sigma-70 family)